MTELQRATPGDPGVPRERRRAAGRGSLRRQWVVALAVMLGLVISTGASALISSHLVVAGFASSATELEAVSAYTARLDAAIATHESMAHELLVDGAMSPARLLAAQRAAEAEFEAGAAILREPAMRDTLDAVYTMWSATLTRAGLWGPRVLTFTFQGVDRRAAEALIVGLDAMSQELLKIDEQARDHLRQNLTAADHSRDIALVIVVGVLGLALVAMLYFARRMALDVLGPVDALREGVSRVRDGELAHRVELPPRLRESELTDLAHGFNEMAYDLATTHRELTFRAMHDSLTGLPNRMALRESLSVAFAQAEARLELPDISVLFVDLDDFKTVNDVHGHAAGDALLVQVAERLATCARSSDLVGRLGGDEFAIVVATDANRSASAIAERVLGALSAPFVVQGQVLSVSASIGVGTTRAETTSPEELLGNADFAMYMAKGHGKKRYELYDPALHAVTTDHAALRSELRQAVENGELRLDYQPVMDLSTGTVVGVEALLRWDHPVRGVVAPLDFIPLAEQSGDIDEIGLWALRTATNQLARWRRAGGGHADLWMAVNLSPVQLRNKQVVAQLANLLADGPVPAQSIVLEITESALVLGVEGATDALATLRATGVRIALDDFGTGLSSLSTLAGLPVDILKIDRAFVSGQDGGIPSTPVLRTVVALAEHLGLDVIAEGIEESGQTDALRTIGCQLGQGFGLARPSTPAQVSALLGHKPDDANIPAPRPARTDLGVDTPSTR